MENNNTRKSKISFRGLSFFSYFQNVKVILFVLFFFLLSSPFAFSQKQVRKDIRIGNKAYKKEKYTDAEIDYRKALEKNARSPEAAYNLGNALYKQEKGQDALEQYRATIDNETNKQKLSMAWHNTGNVFMAGKDYAKSIEAYKQALRNNPHDDETRYNLALAQKLLQDQQNQDQNQEQEQQQQEQQKQEQEQQQQEQQKQEQQQQEEKQQQQNEMSKQNADQILEALMQDEKNTQEKVKEQQIRQQQRKKTDKNW